MRRHSGLHRARLQRGIDLTDLAARTRLSPRVVQRIDEGRFAELPAGLYARAYVQAFASEVGLDPKEVLQELEAVLPPVEDPLDGLREAAQARSRRTWFDGLPARLGAAAADAFALLVIHAIFIDLVGITCGVTARTLFEQAPLAITALCVIPVALYFRIFGGVGGRTPGAWLCRVPADPVATPLRLRTILVRAVRQ